MELNECIRKEKLSEEFNGNLGAFGRCHIPAPMQPLLHPCTAVYIHPRPIFFSLFLQSKNSAWMAPGIAGYLRQ
eukprot:1345599-Amorphochlora_amoeboformis.AAC.2